MKIKRDEFMKKSFEYVTLAFLATLPVIGNISSPVYASSIKEYPQTQVKQDKETDQVRSKYPAMGPGYYTQQAIDEYNEIGQNSPFLSLYTNAAQSAFLNKIKPYCLKAKAEGILPSIVAAQAAIESGWGSSAFHNNYFGVKWTPGCGYPYYTSRTTECNGSYCYKTTARFRSYASIAASFEDHINVLHQKNFRNLLNQSDYHIVARLLQQDHYATDPSYANKLIATIDANGLAAWDKGTSLTQESEKIATIVYVPGYGVLGFRGSGVSIKGSNSVFKDGTKWKTFGSKVINGEEMYLVGNDEYIPKRYTDHYDDGIITIHYAPNYGVNALRKDGSMIQGSNSIFKIGTRWKVSGVAEINNQICYLVGNNEYIPKKYTQWGAGK